MSYHIQNGEAYQALNDAIQTWKTDGYGVVDVAGGDCAVTVSSGTLDASDTLSVAPGEIADNGTTVSVGSQTVGINSVGSGYRYDTVWIDSNGTAQVAEGTATQLSQAEIDQNLSRFELFTPTIPFPSTTPATVIAVVAVNDSDSSITSANLQDRRVAATVTTTLLDAAAGTIKSAPTLFVRSSGDDSNTGLNSSNPKATIQSAINDAALAGYDDWIVIDIQESGASFNEALTIDKYHPPVKILGPTDGSGDPDVTLDAAGTGSNWLDVFGGRVFFENVKIGDAPAEGRVIENSTADFKNCLGPSSLSDANFIAGSSNSYVQIWPSTEFDISGLASDRCLAMAGGFALIQGTLRGGTQWVFSAEENAGFIILNGAVIDAGGDGGIPVHSRESSFGKTSADHQNATVGVEAANFGGVDITPDAGFTNTTNRKQITGTGYINDDADSSPTFQTNDGEIPGIPDSSAAASPGFDTWQQVSINRPAQLSLSVVAETDGASVGRVRLAVDEDGGTTADYAIPIADISADNSAGSQQRGGLSMVIPPGAQYQIENAVDPNGGNQIFVAREFTL